MTAYLSFEGQVVPMTWGKSVYTVLPLPDEVAEALHAQGARRVEGEINDHPINLALTKAPVLDAVFLWTGKSLLQQIGITPGEPLEIRLRKADDTVETPDDVALALRQADATPVWEALTPGKKRGLLHGINTAKRAETRTKRIAKLIADIT
ncbi:YdeI/OmpD-associated family protein [Yoonia sp. SS1-5]|uniref:YdeI/OmpD-associated family protein n=1 Tax=Yoonia rhodophyticola TaxID=3137370 RepID=A0AAN0NJL6_9RHOB